LFRRGASDAGNGRDHGLLEGDRTASGPGRQWQRCGYFPPRAAERPHITHGAMARFASRSKIAAPLPSSAGAAALRCRFRVLARPAILNALYYDYAVASAFTDGKFSAWVFFNKSAQGSRDRCRGGRWNDS